MTSSSSDTTLARQGVSAGGIRSAQITRDEMVRAPANRYQSVRSRRKTIVDPRRRFVIHETRLVILEVQFVIATDARDCALHDAIRDVPAIPREQEFHSVYRSDRDVHRIGRCLSRQGRRARKRPISYRTLPVTLVSGAGLASLASAHFSTARGDRSTGSSRE